MAESKNFGPRHLIALLVALGISALIIFYSNEVRRLDELGYLGVFLIMLFGNATIILPAPGLVSVFLLGGTLPVPLFVGLAAGFGAALGELTSYLAGYSGSGVIARTSMYVQVRNIVDRYGMWAIMVAALIPNPLFDLAGIAAGALNIKWWKFLLGAGVGNMIKLSVLAYAGNWSIDDSGLLSSMITLLPQTFVIIS